MLSTYYMLSPGDAVVNSKAVVLAHITFQSDITTYNPVW